MTSDVVQRAREFVRVCFPQRPIRDWQRPYIRMYFYHNARHQRFVAYVNENGLFCQDCRGMGGEHQPMLDDGTGPWDECGWCGGTGLTTRWLRGVWLRMKKAEKKERE